MTIAITPELLRAYFEQHLADPVGGPGCCPIQQVLIIEGAADATVGHARWYHSTRPQDDHYDLPYFAQHFIEIADRGYRVDVLNEGHPGGHVTWESMTGADALAVLETALELSNG